MRFAIVPEAAIRDPDLTPSELRVLVALYCFADKKSTTAWPSRAVLADFLGIKDVSGISKITTRLEQKGWLKKNKKTSARGTKKYRITIPERLNKVASLTTLANKEEQQKGGETDHFDNNSQGGESAHFEGGEFDHFDDKKAPPQGGEFDHLQGGETDHFEGGETRHLAYEQTIEQTIEHKKIDKKNITDVVNEKLKPPPASNPDRFEEFYSAYPRKVGKANAAKAWKKLKPSTDLINQILIDIEQRVSTGAWSLDQKQFIPHPATYLNGERWEDEINPRSQPNENYQANSSSGRTWLTPSERTRAAHAAIYGGNPEPQPPAMAAVGDSGGDLRQCLEQTVR